MAKSLLAVNYDTGQSYRSMAWVARASTLGLVASIFLNITLVFLVICLFPLKQVQPYLLALKDKGDQVVQIEPISLNTKGMDLLVEGLCRRYVSLRETLDGVGEQARWKDVAFWSSDELWQEFEQLMKPDNPKSPLKKHIDDKVVRSVSIKVSSQVAEKVWQVEWEAIHLHNGVEIERNRWVSTLFVEMRENTLKSEDKFLNPIGFTVIGYAVSKRED